MSKTNKSVIKKGIRKRSFVWTYFDKDQKNQTKCSICYKILPYNSSTSSMQSHLSIDHCINSKVPKKSTTLLNDNDISDIESGNENGFVETGHKKLNKLLVNFIVGTDQPISIVRHPDFVNLVS